MIYLFYGSDRDKVLVKSEALLKLLFQKDESLSIEKYDEDNLEIEALRALAGSQSLFGGKSAVVIDNALREHEEFSDLLEMLKDSTHIFILREGDLTKALLKPAEKHIEKIELFEKIEGKKVGFNIFAFTDAIGSRNKKQSWVLYQMGLASGMAAEEMFWKVVWQVKTLLIVQKTKNVTETDMKDYPYKKAKENLRYWKGDELEKLSEKLVIGYHRARRGEGEVETFVEKLLLTL